MMENQHSEVEKLIGKVLGIDSVAVNDKTSPENVESWDSFNGLLLATELEKKFKAKFTAEEIASVKNVGDIKAILKKHGIKT